ncbi:hypothetical protein GCM10008018_49260 [Paenibacillus marchantiophytorum]|uniref:DUF2306 domain-containing protein n=1 Tax=Paenibacillus marchantiophytorum TaxID=1619310 RepID=A0ABQ1F2L1_9BACL|nr:DUF2306 domain-containing protein [Paenibacillus marchantiophytorum]GFZ97024.1 hypothetical protein GCM10008018_49260 [Paenibacillus marchantiophytorum]
MKERNTGRKWAFGILAFFAVAISLYALILYGLPDGLRKQMFVTDKGPLPELWYKILWAHAVSAGLALGIGWIQFIKRLRQSMPNLHRSIGYLYTVLITVAGLTGLYLAFYANGGWIGRIGFGMLSLMWLYTLYHSLRSIIVLRNPIAHGNWMIRNYALSCAAITLRIYIPLAVVLFGVTDTNDSFIVIAWLCWIPNLLFAHWLINRRMARPAYKSTYQRPV